MSILQDSVSNESDTESNATPSDEICRRIVRILHERDSEISLRSLADLLAGSKSTEAGTRDAESIKTRLHHVHLPKLAASGLVELDETGRMVSTTNHSVYEREPADEARHGSDERTSERHRQILEIVAAERGVIARASLARKLARWEVDGQPTSEIVESVESQLHHLDLPELAEAGLIEYDQDDRTVRRNSMMGVDTTAFDSGIDMCQHPDRRIVLGVLAGEQRSVTLKDLTQAVLKYNYQTSLTEASQDELLKVRTSLRHLHLPKLDSKGLIDHDPERELVKPTEQFNQVEPTLSVILELDPSLKAPIAL